MEGRKFTGAPDLLFGLSRRGCRSAYLRLQLMATRDPRLRPAKQQRHEDDGYGPESLPPLLLTTLVTTRDPLGIRGVAGATLLLALIVATENDRNASNCK